MGKATANQSKLTVAQGLLYGSAHYGVGISALVYTSWYTRRYCPVDNASATILPMAWITTAFMIVKLLDGLSGPVFGYLSDNTRTRWGRRIPYILFGTIPMCIALLLIWTPPTSILAPNSIPLFAVFCILTLIFWLSYTAVQTPIFSLLPEIATSNDDRIKLSMYQSIFMLVSSIIGYVMAPVLVQKFGFAVMGAVFVAMTAVSLYLPGFLLKEKYVPPEETSAEKQSFFSSIGAALKNRAYLIYIISKLFAQIGFQLIMISVAYIVPTIFKKPDTYIAIIMMGTVVATIASFFLVQALCKKYSKRGITIFGMAIMGAFLPVLFFMGQYDLSITIGPLTITETMIGLALFTIQGFPAAVIMVLQSPIVADTIDIDEIETGTRREAVYFGIHGMIFKFGLAIAGLIMGQLCAKCGYTVENHLGVDLIPLAASASVIIGAVILIWYPVDKKKEEWIRSVLDSHGAAGTEQG